MTHARFTTGAALAAALLLAAQPARAQQPAAAPPPPVSMLGQVAPDFTLPSVTRANGAVRPFHLADFKGQTVVLFFFPKARTKGWTIQVEAYRDQYATLFHDGQQVVVVGISADPDTALSAWAAEKNAPFRFASDPTGTVIKQYGAWNEEGKYANRHTIIVGPDGKIAFEQRPFRVTAQESYTALGEAVDKLAPKGK